MTDEKKPTDATPAPSFPKPKVGQNDYGKTVSTAGDEPMSGTIADITDGDSHHKKHK